MNKIIIKPYISLSNQDFPDDTIISIEKETFRDISFKEGETNLNLKNCKFKKLYVNNSEEIDFKEISLHFTDCYIGDIEIESIESKNVSINFSSCIISGKINNAHLRNVEINNCFVTKELFLLNLNRVRISYTEENIFHKRWERLFKSIGIENCLDFLKQKQSFNIHDTKNISFSTNEVKNEKRGIYERNPNATDEDYKTGYYLSPDEKKLLDINVRIKYSIEIDKVETKIINSFLNSLTLSGYCNGKIAIENTKIEHWYLHDFSSQDEIAFFNISPLKKPSKNGKIEFRMCNLDKARFDNIIFSEYSIISFYKTKIGKANFTSCSFPTTYTSFEKFKSLENVHYPEKQSDNYYKDQYEVFLQLKQALESTGNFYESQKLQAISNDALKKINDVSIWDKSILWINSKSNNHGLSIKRPLLFFIFFSITFYILYLLSIGRIFNSKEIDFTLVGYYFSFIDLTHRSDFLVSKNEFNFWSLTLDSINKIIVGFFIYQFIAAFRKYGKK